MASGDLQFTIAEAASLMPPLTERQLATIIRALGWKPAGRKHTGRAGHPAHTYDAGEMFRLHNALLPFIRT